MVRTDSDRGIRASRFGVFIIIAVAVLRFVDGAHVRMESKMHREKFSRLGRAHGETRHEVVFAVRQNNMDVMERMVAERSTPGSSKYQQWMTFVEVGEITSNAAGTAAIMDWLGQQSLVDITWQSKRGEYIKAIAPLSMWEELFATEFYEWQDTHDGQESNHLLADHYNLPDHLQQHVSAVFGTVQVPPIIHSSHRTMKKNVFKTKFLVNTTSPLNTTSPVSPQASSSGVTVSFLDTFYNIPSNKGMELR
jgi:hypothetical protein